MKPNFSGIYSIAKSTFLETIRDRILYTIFIASLFIIGFSYVASRLTYAYPERIALHFGLTSIEFCIIGISIFVGVSLITKEVEKRSILTIISKPIQRGEFLVAKFLGLSSIIFLAEIAMGVLLALILNAFSFELKPIFIQCLLLQALEGLLILAITIFFSSFSGKYLASVFAFSFYLAGNSSEAFSILRDKMENPLIKLLLDYLRDLIPNLNRLNLKNLVLYEKSIPIELFATQLTYGFLYTCAVLFISCALFSKRDFS